MRPVNLLPQSARPYVASGKSGGGSYVVIGVLAALVLMVAGYVLTSNKITSHKNEIAQAQQNSTFPWGYNPPVWQGAYVFNVTTQSGLVFRGGITHVPNGELPSYYNNSLFVTRSLYISNVLYTVSSGMVKMNSLSDLSEIGSVSLA